jgi:hypothetical protein
MPKRVDEVRLRTDRERETSDRAGSGGFSTSSVSVCSVEVDSKDEKEGSEE